jgi:hypothetical protein
MRRHHALHDATVSGFIPKRPDIRFPRRCPHVNDVLE